MKGIRGFTLIELLIFVLIVGIGLVGTIAVFGTSVRGSVDPVLRKQTLSLAESMLREIMQKSAQDDPTGTGAGCTPATVPACIPNNPVTRPNYNDVGDYNGYNQLGITQINGAAVPGLNLCRQQVLVAAGVLQGVAGSFITVTATCNPGAHVVVLNGFRANY